LQCGQVDVGLVGEGEADKGLVGYGGGSGDAVFVDVGNGGVVLGDDGKDEGCWTGREVVQVVEGEGPEEES